MIQILNPNNNFKEVEEVSNGMWVNVFEPTPSELDHLVNDFNLPRDFIDDVGDIDELPRVDRYGEWNLTIVRIPIPCADTDDLYETIPFGIFTSLIRHQTVTLTYRRNELIPDFISHCRLRRVEIENEASLVFRLIYSSAVWYLKYLKRIKRLVAENEIQLEKSIRNEDMLELLSLQKCLVLFNTSIRGNEVIVGRLRSIYKHAQDDDFIEDLVIELHQANHMVTIYNNNLTVIMDALSNIISNNVNKIMKQLTSLNIILMFPTIIASFYGMNVDLFIGKNPYAFIYIVVGATILSLISLIFFRKVKWF